MQMNNATDNFELTFLLTLVVIKSKTNQEDENFFSLARELIKKLLFWKSSEVNAFFIFFDKRSGDFTVPIFLRCLF